MNLHNLTIREIIEGYTLHKFSSTELFAQILGHIEDLEYIGAVFGLAETIDANDAIIQE